MFSAPLPSGSHLAPVFLIKDGRSLVPFTLLIQGPEKVRVPRQTASATFNSASWVDQQGGAKIRAVYKESGQRAPSPGSGTQGPKTSLCPAMLSIMETIKHKKLLCVEHALLALCSALNRIISFNSHHDPIKSILLLFLSQR